MAENTIKTKDSIKGNATVIKTLDRPLVLAEKTKDAFVKTKNSVQGFTDDSFESESVYAEDRAGEMAGHAVSDAAWIAKNGKDKIKEEAKKQIEKQVQKHYDIKAETGLQEGNVSGRKGIKVKAENAEMPKAEASPGKPKIRTAESVKGGADTSAKSAGKSTVKVQQHMVKTAENTMKTAEMTAKTTVMTAEKSSQVAKAAAESAAKTAERSASAAVKSAEAAERTATTAARVIANAVRAMVTSAHNMFSTAGAAAASAIPMIILGLVIMAVAVLCTGSTVNEGAGLSSAEVIREINADWQEQISEIKAGYENVTVTGTKAAWNEIYSLYTAWASGEKSDNWNEKKQVSLIFWEMHSVHSELLLDIAPKTAAENRVTVCMKTSDYTFGYSSDGTVIKLENVTYQNPNTLEQIEEQYKGREITAKLNLTINCKSIDEMAEFLGLDDWQKEQAVAMTDAEFDSFWRERLYGLKDGSGDIVAVALAELGNVGGWPYWEYAGFSERVEWCACFVSWCAGQCGYIDSGQFINTGSPPLQVEFFRERGQWLDGSITPSPGMIIFFDWYNADFADHVGIVEYVEDGVVHTVEGNSDDAVQQGCWMVGDGRIMGYGWIATCTK